MHNIAQRNGPSIPKLCNKNPELLAPIALCPPACLREEVAVVAREDAAHLCKKGCLDAFVFKQWYREAAEEACVLQDCVDLVGGQTSFGATDESITLDTFVTGLCGEAWCM